MKGTSCDGCRHYLGGGCCRINLEGECAAGGFEAWEPAEGDIVISVRIPVDAEMAAYCRDHEAEIDAYIREVYGAILADVNEKVMKGVIDRMIGGQHE